MKKMKKMKKKRGEKGEKRFLKNGDSVVIAILGVLDPSSLDAPDVFRDAGLATSTRC